VKDFAVLSVTLENKKPLSGFAKFTGNQINHYLTKCGSALYRVKPLLILQKVWQCDLAAQLQGSGDGEKEKSPLRHGNSRKLKDKQPDKLNVTLHTAFSEHHFLAIKH